MTDNQAAMRSYAAFNLAVQVVGQALDHEYTNPEYGKILAALTSIANGESTRHPSPAEINSALPPYATDALRQNNQDVQQQWMRDDVQIAADIIRAQQGKVGHRGPRSTWTVTVRKLSDDQYEIRGDNNTPGMFQHAAELRIVGWHKPEFPSRVLNFAEYIAWKNNLIDNDDIVTDPFGI